MYARPRELRTISLSWPVIVRGVVSQIAQASENWCVQMDDLPGTGLSHSGKRKREQQDPTPGSFEELFGESSSAHAGEAFLLPDSCVDGTALNDETGASSQPCEDNDPPMLENDRVYLESMCRQMDGSHASGEPLSCRHQRSRGGSPSALESELDHNETASSPHVSTLCLLPQASSAPTSFGRDVLDEAMSRPNPRLRDKCHGSSRHDDACLLNDGETSLASRGSQPDPADCSSLVRLEDSGAPQVEDSQVPRSIEDQGAEQESTPAKADKGTRGKGCGKPIEARVAGSASEWKWFPSLRSAEGGTGIPADQVRRLADLQCDYLGWQFRWPEPQPSPKPEQESSGEACDIAALARRIRKVPSAQRRRLVAALPEATRTALTQHLQSPQPSPEMRPAAPPPTDLHEIMADLPEVLRRVPQEARCKVLAGVRDLGERYKMLLGAPDIATVARLLSEVLPAQRRTLLEAMPEDTQQALQEHMLAKRAAASGKSDDSRGCDDSKAVVPAAAPGKSDDSRSCDDSRAVVPCQP